MNNYKDINEECNLIVGELSKYLTFPEGCAYVLFKYSKDDVIYQYIDDEMELLSSFNELSENEIYGKVEDVVWTEDEGVFLIVSSDKYTERCISVVNNLNEYIKCWEPKFEEIFKELMNYNVEGIYSALLNIAHGIDNNAKIDIEEVINKNFIIEADEEDDGRVNLLLSILREIMITEDIRFNQQYHRGKYLLIDAFNDIAINKMNYSEWKKKYRLN